MKRVFPALALTASGAFAQCVMCQRTAAAQNAARIHVLSVGILLLGIPPFLILTGILLLAYKRRGSNVEPEPEHSEELLAQVRS